MELGDVLGLENADLEVVWQSRQWGRGSGGGGEGMASATGIKSDDGRGAEECWKQQRMSSTSVTPAFSAFLCDKEWGAELMSVGRMSRV
jgi:hypothetical protein